ncbi:hypothetical protein J2785_007314 [Burkholderia ambifaria]|nr:hypothetical protein [Burkholderia ambifaria]
MNRVVPWADLVMLIGPYAPEGRRGRPPFAVEAMLRIHFLQQWFGLSVPEMEEALHDVPLYRKFAGLDNWMVRLPDESTILRFRHLLEKHKLAAQILVLVNDILRDKGLMLRAGTVVVDATLISAPSSTKDASGERAPEMHQSKVSTRGTHLDSQYFVASPQLARLTQCDSVSVSPSSSLVSSVPSELFPHTSYSCPS